MKKKITLDEFKAWLEGVEDMQGTNWSPDAEQWKRIRQKINQISVPIIKNTPTTFQQSFSRSGNDNMSENNQLQIPRIPTSFERAGNIRGAPPLNQVSIIPEPARLVRETDPTGKEKIKTPDIDTSGKQYQSSFE